MTDDAIRLRVRSSNMCATCLSVYECYVRVCACGERGPTGQISAAEGRPHRATKVEGRERNKTRKTRRAISSRRLAGHLRHPRKISLHQFSTVQSGRIRQENSEVRALRMVFLRNALLRLHHRRRWRRTTGSETRETASRAEPREEERSTTERKPAPRPRACRRFHSLLNHGTNLRESEFVCVFIHVRAGRGGEGSGRAGRILRDSVDEMMCQNAHLHRGTTSRGGDETRQSECVRAQLNGGERRAFNSGAPQSVCNKGRCIVGGSLLGEIR